MPVVVPGHTRAGLAPDGHVPGSVASPGIRRGPCQPSAPRRRSPWVPAPVSGRSWRPRSGISHRSRGRTWRPIAQEEPQASSLFAQFQQEVAGLLGDPGGVGLAVTPARWTRRVSSSMKNSTYSRRSQMVSTVNKSQATIPAACWRRNARHDGAVRRGAGSNPWLRRVVRIAVAETWTPSRSSSPWRW
jgi:hypothetical protein